MKILVTRNEYEAVRRTLIEAGIPGVGFKEFEEAEAALNDPNAFKGNPIKMCFTDNGDIEVNIDERLMIETCAAIDEHKGIIVPTVMSIIASAKVLYNAFKAFSKTLEAKIKQLVSTVCKEDGLSTEGEKEEQTTEEEA